MGGKRDRSTKSHAPARDDPTAEGGWEAETDETGEGNHRCFSLYCV